MKGQVSRTSWKGFSSSVVPAGVRRDVAYGGGSETGVFESRGDLEAGMFESSAPSKEVSAGAIVELNLKGSANQRYQNHITHFKTRKTYHICSRLNLLHP